MEITFVTDKSQMFNAIYLNGTLIGYDWENLSARYILEMLAKHQVVDLEIREIDDQTYDDFYSNKVPENRKDLPL